MWFLSQQVIYLAANGFFAASDIFRCKWYFAASNLFCCKKYRCKSFEPLNYSFLSEFDRKLNL